MAVPEMFTFMNDTGPPRSLQKPAIRAVSKHFNAAKTESIPAAGAPSHPAANGLKVTSNFMPARHRFLSQHSGGSCVALRPPRLAAKPTHTRRVHGLKRRH
jgi:hypothetical protein